MDSIREFLVVNSFASKPFGGNPAAVFTHAERLNKSTMQLIARQLNLVETVFVLKDTVGNADFHLLYFTPTEELPVAGHPTIAAILALLESNQIHTKEKLTNLIIRTGKGNQKVSIDTTDIPTVIMRQPDPTYLLVVEDREPIANVLGIHLEDLHPDLPIQPVDTGLGHLIVPVKSLDALMRIQRRAAPLKEICTKLGIREVQAFSFETYEPGFDIHTRNICPRDGIEDPGCGVGNGALGAYLAEHSYKGDFKVKAEQGHIVNMPCAINIQVTRGLLGSEVSIGGTGRTMIKGQFFI